jgi:hypothetical protein
MKQIKGVDVLRILCPEGGWVVTESDYDSIVWTDERPRCTKKEFENKLKELQDSVAENELNRQQAKNALLEKLGITEDEARLLLS